MRGMSRVFVVPPSDEDDVVFPTIPKPGIEVFPKTCTGHESGSVDGVHARVNPSMCEGAFYIMDPLFSPVSDGAVRQDEHGTAYPFSQFLCEIVRKL